MSFIYITLNINNTIPVTKAIETVGILANIFYSMSFVIVFATIWILFITNNHSSLIGFLFYFYGTLLSILEIRYKLSNMSSFDMLSQSVFRSFSPLAFGIILSAVISFLIIRKNASS